MGGCPQSGEGIFPCQGVTLAPRRGASIAETLASGPSTMWLPLVGLALGIALGLVLNVNVSPDLARYSAVAILAGLDSVLGAIRAELDAHYDNRIFISGFITNTLVAVALTFVGDRLGIAPSVGMKKGMVANIDQTVNSIASSVEKAERLSGYKISTAFVSVGGSHISSQNSRGVG